MSGTLDNPALCIGTFPLQMLSFGASIKFDYAAITSDDIKFHSILHVMA